MYSDLDQIVSQHLEMSVNTLNLNLNLKMFPTAVPIHHRYKFSKLIGGGGAQGMISVHDSYHKILI